jgi:hypothetical protein
VTTAAPRRSVSGTLVDAKNLPPSSARLAIVALLAAF